MKIVKVKDYEEMSQYAADYLIKRINEIDRPVLGLATGSTPEGMYEKLIQANKEGKISFKNITTFNLDEYVGLSEEDPNSYHFFMKDKLLDHVDIQEGNYHIPDGNKEDLEKECQEYEKLIQEAGRIDVQILGVGINGHIGFNEPGTSFTSRTHIVELSESTRQANSRFFNSIDDVPTKAITMGIETIMESKDIILLVSGEQKAETLARLLEGEVSEDFPVSVLKKHNHVTLIADEAALSKTKI